MNLFKRCLQRKLLSLILIGLIVEGFIGFVDINHVFGQPSITLKWITHAGTSSTWMGPLAADLNNDGLMEIVITGEDGVAALDPISGNVIWKMPYGGCHSPFEIIDLNKDGIPEILLSVGAINGSPAGGVVALHGNNGSVYWYNQNAAGDGKYIAVADINADGYPEIYSATQGKVTALTYDGRIFASTYTYYTCWGGMTIGDTDFDGVFEVYLGERSNTYPYPGSPGRGLRAFWADNLTEIWCKPDILCSSQAPVLADVDNDGDLEIIILHQRGGIGVFNTDGSVNTYKGKYRYSLNLGLTCHSNPPVADLDGDGNLELITCGDASHERFYPPKIWDLVDWKLDATLPFPSDEPPGVADIDGDGKLEIINCNPQNVTIFKYNLATKSYDIIYTIPIAMAHPFSIAQDIDGDGKLELVFDLHNSWVYVYDVEAPAPTPKPRSGLYFYSQYRTRVPVYVPPPGPPAPKITEISPNNGETNVPVILSQLSFKLTDYQCDPINYTVITDPDIGSTSGINVPNGKITIPVSGLAYSTTYAWTVTATDGTHITTKTFTFTTINLSPWYNTDWRYRKNVIIDYTKVAADQTNFPFLIDLTDIDLKTKAQLDGDDILFTDQNQVKLSQEIEQYDSTTGRLIAWVNVPYLSSTTYTILYMYYGNPTCENQQNSTAVWDTNYKLVLHLDESTGTHYDSTINGNNGTPFGSLVQGATGAIGSCVEFNGGCVELPRVCTSEVQFTFSAWIYAKSGARYIISEWWSYQGAFLQVASSATAIEFYVNNIIVSRSITFNKWYYVVGTFDGATARLYVNDGSPASTSTSNPIWPSQNMYVGDRSDHNRKFNGFIDEVRVSNIARNAAWILTEYNNQLNPAEFYAVCPEEVSSSEPFISEPDPADGAINIPITLNELSFTIHDYQNDLMNVTVTTDPNIGSTSLANVPNARYTVSISGLSYTTTYNWTVTATDGTYITTKTYTFTTELARACLTISTVGNGSVIKNPDNATYAYGTLVQLTAVAGFGCTFSQWEGDLTGNNNPATIIMNGNKTVIAVFIETEYTLTINVSPIEGGSVNVNKTAPYHYGDIVELTAVPNAGWSFSHWERDLTGSQNPANIIIDDNKTVTAVFTQDQYNLTITVIGNGNVTIEPYKTTYTYGENVTLTATADPDWTFAGWSGDLTGSENPTTITMDGDKVVNATFIQEMYTLTVNVFGNGSVTKNPDQPTYAYGTEVNLTATPDLGWAFSEWTGDASGSDSSTVIIMDGNKVVNATFIEEAYTLTVNVFGNGSVTKDPDQPTYTYGAEVNLTASADPGWTFSEWTGDASGTDTVTTIFMDGNKTVNATFIQEAYTLAINIFGNGTVTKDPDLPTYTYGTEVNLTAVADPGWTFSEWSGDLTGSENPTAIIMDGNKTVNATFIQEAYTLTVNIFGNGSVSKDPNQPTYTYGTEVNLTATPDPGWAFSEWTGDASGTNPSTTITMDGDKTVNATFIQEAYTLTINIFGNGSVSKDPDQPTYTYGTQVQLTASANIGWSFSHWSGNITSSDNPITFIITSNMTITAHFKLKQYTITASVSGTGGTIEPLGIVTVTHGEDVTFTITPNTGYHILDVLVDGEPQGAITTYTFYAVSMNHTITAFFAPNEYTLTVNVSPEGSGTVTLNNTGPYYYGDAVQLTAEPNTGWYFSQWNGDMLGSQNPATIIIDGDKSITAVSTREKLILNVTIIGKGSVIKEPDKTIYTRGETVALTAIAGLDWTFSGWSGDLSGLVNPATITMTGNRTVTATFTINQWWCRDWQYRRTITIDHTKVSGTLTDFPVLIEILDSSLIGKTQPNGYDFVFTDANNMKLNHQIEFYDSTVGHLIVWVNVPYLSSSADTILYMYYGNPTCENQQNSTAVWDTNYMLVLHLNESAGTLYDSTINGNNGTPFKGVLQGVTGKIDGAVTFDPGLDYIEIPYSDTLAGYTEAFTVSFWIRLEDTSRRQTILCKYDTSGNMRSWQIEYDPLNRPNNPFWFFASQDGIIYSEWWASFVPQANTWYYVTIVWEANAIPKFYINGVQVPTVGTATISSIFNNSGTPLDIGRSIYAGRNFKGSLDEIRISNIARSADWILTAYNNQLNPTTFYSVGAEETFQEAYILTLHVDGNGSVTITPEKIAYTQGETVTLIATPGEGYEFQGWSGDLTGTENPATIIITGDMNITAHFTQI